MNICSFILYISLSSLYYSNEDISSNIDEILFDGLSLEELFIKQDYTKGQLLAFYDKIDPKIIAQELIDAAPIEEEIIAQELIDAAPIEEEIIAQELIDAVPTNANKINDKAVSIEEKKLEIEITNNFSKEKLDNKQKISEKKQGKVIPLGPKKITNAIKKTYKAIYQEIAGPTLKQITASLNSQELKKLVRSIVPYSRPKTHYNYAIKPVIINQKKYNIENVHLDRVFFYKQYFPTLYKAIDQANIPLIDSLNNIIGITNEVEFKNEKPFIYAVKKGNINVIRKLLSLGYNPNERDKKGNAPIHLAILANRVDIVTELIKFKANVVAPNGNNMRPIRLAEQRKNLFIVNILRKVSADNIDTHSVFSQYLIKNQIEKK